MVCLSNLQPLSFSLDSIIPGTNTKTIKSSLCFPGELELQTNATACVCVCVVLSVVVFFLYCLCKTTSNKRYKMHSQMQ